MLKLFSFSVRLHHWVLTWFFILSFPLLFLSYARTQEKVVERKLDRKPSEPNFRSELIRGRVLWQAVALKKEFDITTVPEAAESSLAFFTAQGKLLPIVENLRGRAFRKDARLRDTDLELSVRMFEKHPYVQVITVYEVEEDRRYEIDYWCDVCAIVMYETGPCACCQDANRMRKRIVKDGIPQDEEAKE